MKKIKLTQNKYALIDDEDFEFLNQWKWSTSSKGYAVRKVQVGVGHKNRTFYNIYMHRVVGNIPEELQTDHINHKKLDNRKNNLRAVTNQQNHFNMPLSSRNKTGYKGVYWFKRDKNWQAQITLNAKKIHLGYFDSKLNAIHARKEAEKIYHVI